MSTRFFYSSLLKDTVSHIPYTQSLTADGSYVDTKGVTANYPGRFIPAGSSEDKTTFRRDTAVYTGSIFLPQLHAGSDITIGIHDRFVVNSQNFRASGPPSNIGGFDGMYSIPVTLEESDS